MKDVFYPLVGAIVGSIIGFLINRSGLLLFSDFFRNSIGLAGQLVSIIIIAGSVGAFLGFVVLDIVYQKGNKNIPLLIAVGIALVYGICFVAFLHPQDETTKMKLGECLAQAEDKNAADVCNFLYGSGSPLEENYN